MKVHKPGILLSGLLLSLVGIGPASAHDSVAGNHFFDDCDNVSQNDSLYQANLHVSYIPGNNNVYGARGTAMIEDLKACSAPSAGLSGASLVMAANVQRSNGHLVQLGYGIANCAQASCQFGLPANSIRFLWTPADSTNGTLELPPGAPIPTTGVKYRFTISSFDDFGQLDTEWHYEIRRQDTQQVVWSATRTRSWSAGGVMAWTGAEVISLASMFNRKSTSELHYISNIKFRGLAENWTTYPGTTPCSKHLYNDGDNRGVPTNQWAVCVSGTDLEGDLRIDVFTKLHDAW